MKYQSAETKSNAANSSKLAMLIAKRAGFSEVRYQIPSFCDRINLRLPLPLDYFDVTYIFLPANETKFPDLVVEKIGDNLYRAHYTESVPLF